MKRDFSILKKIRVLFTMAVIFLIGCYGFGFSMDMSSGGKNIKNEPELSSNDSIKSFNGSMFEFNLC